MSASQVVIALGGIIYPMLTERMMMSYGFRGKILVKVIPRMIGRNVHLSPVIRVRYCRDHGSAEFEQCRRYDVDASRGMARQEAGGGPCRESARETGEISGALFGIVETPIDH